MHPRRFDQLSQAVAARASRRTTLKGAAMGIGAALFGRQASTQSTTPVADDQPISLLFVQTFATGTFTEDFTLTLEQGSGQTIYFSDRPDRLVGSIADATFLDGRAFDPTDPPNAAVVAQAANGEDILLVELLDPELDPDTGSITYRTRPLAKQPESAALVNYADRQVDATLDASFGPVSLFIDNLSCAQDGAACNTNSDCCSGVCCEDNDICPAGACW